MNQQTLPIRLGSFHVFFVGAVRNYAPGEVWSIDKKNTISTKSIVILLTSRVMPMSTSPSPISDSPVTLLELMHITQVHFKLIEQRTSHLKPLSGETIRDFRFPLAVAIQAIYASDGPTKTNMSLQEFRILREQSEAILAQAKAEKIRMDIDERKGTLIPAEEAKAAVANLVVCFRAKLMALPSKCALQVAGLDDPRQAERVLKDAVYEALDELSQTPLTSQGVGQVQDPGPLQEQKLRPKKGPKANGLDERHPGISQATH